MNTNIDSRYTPIPGYSKYGISKNGEVINLSTMKVLSMQKYPNGYCYYHLKSDNMVNKTCTLHRLLMTTFRPIKNMDEMEVNHIDGIKTNNAISNLEWTDRRSNIEHAGMLGLTSKCIPVEVLNTTTGEITRYPSATSCSRALGLTKDAVLFRLSKDENHVFPEGNQYRKYDGVRPWSTSSDAEFYRKYSNGTSKSVTLRCIKSGDILEFPNITAAAKHINKSLPYLSVLLSGKRHPVVPGGYQVKYTIDTSDWRQCDYFQEISQLVLLIETIDINGNVTIHEGISATAKKLNINLSTLKYRLTSNGTRRFSDGNLYRYYTTICPTVQ